MVMLSGSRTGIHVSRRQEHRWTTSMGLQVVVVGPFAVSNLAWSVLLVDSVVVAAGAATTVTGGCTGLVLVLAGWWCGARCWRVLVRPALADGCWSG